MPPVETKSKKKSFFSTKVKVKVIDLASFKRVSLVEYMKSLSLTVQKLKLRLKSIERTKKIFPQNQTLVYNTRRYIVKNVCKVSKFQSLFLINQRI